MINITVSSPSKLPDLKSKRSPNLLAKPIITPKKVRIQVKKLDLDQSPNKDLRMTMTQAGSDNEYVKFVVT